MHVKMQESFGFGNFALKNAPLGGQKLAYVKNKKTSEIVCHKKL